MSLFQTSGCTRVKPFYNTSQRFWNQISIIVLKWTRIGKGNVTVANHVIVGSDAGGDDPKFERG